MRPFPSSNESHALTYQPHPHPSGPAPPTGVHRYVFLLYKQSEKIKYEAPEQRILFKVAAEAEKYYLGDPEAVIYFTSKKDK